MQTNTVLAGASAAQAQRAVDQLAVQALGGFALGSAGRVDQITHVEIAIAHMADHEIRNTRLGGFVHRIQQRIGQTGDRHTGVGGDAAAARTGLDAGKVGVVPRRPQPRAFFGRLCPLEAVAPVVGHDFLHCGDLLLHARG